MHHHLQWLVGAVEKKCTCWPSFPCGRVKPTQDTEMEEGKSLLAYMACHHDTVVVVKQNEAGRKLEQAALMLVSESMMVMAHLLRTVSSHTAFLHKL